MDKASGGSIVWNLDIDSKKFDSKLSAAKSKAGEFAGVATKKGFSVGSAFSAIGKSAAVAAAGIGIATAALKPFVDAAIKRVDILNNFPKVMSNMGISAEEATKASSKIVTGIKGLPTALDTATLAVQRLTTKTRDVSKSTDIFLALNNAVLAGGAPMELQASATEQFAQAFAKGRPDMMEWRSMMAAMPAQLDQVAKAMGLVNADALGEQLRNGEISMEDFSNQLVKLNTKGVGGLPSLAEQAKNATAGIGTAMANARIAVTRGIEGIITAIGSEKVASTVTKVGESIEKALGFIERNIDVVAVVVGTILTAAFIKLGIAVATATWPILLVAAAFAGLYLLYKKFKPQIDQVVGAFKWLWEAIKPIRDFVANQFKNAWEDLRDSFDSVMKTVEPFLPQLKILGAIILGIALVPLALLVAGVLIAIGVITVIITVVARLIGWLSKLFSWWMNLGVSIKNTMENAGKWVRDGVTNMIKWFSEMPGRIARSIGNLGSLLYQKGRDMIQGLINGAASLLSRLGEFFADKVPAPIRGAFKKALGIQSPSKVFAEYGKNIVQGLTMGITNSEGMLTAAVNGLSSTVMSPTIQPATGSSGSSIVQNNTIYNQVDYDKALTDLAWRIAN